MLVKNNLNVSSVKNMIISIGNAPGVEGDVQPGYAGIGRREVRVVSRPG